MFCEGLALVAVLQVRTAGIQRCMLQESMYQQLAAADNVSLDPPPSGEPGMSSGQAFSIHALSGDYRRILHKPQGLSWKLLEYSDADAPLALSELELLSGGKLPPALQGECSHC